MAEFTHIRLQKCRRKGWKFATARSRRATSEELYQLLWLPPNPEVEESYLIDLLAIDAFRQGEQLAFDGAPEPEVADGK